MKIVEAKFDHPNFRKIFVDTFSDEPSFRYMLQDEHTRKSGVGWICDMKRRTQGGYYHGFSTPESNRGFAWWISPHHRPPGGVVAQLKAGFWQAPFRLGLPGTRRMLQFGYQESRLLKKYLQTPWWILDVIATDPAHQRSGIGGALMQPIFERSARESIPCFVLTHNPRNVGFYQKYGFKLVIEEPIGGVGTPVAYGLERAPFGSSL